MLGIEKNTLYYSYKKFFFLNNVEYQDFLKIPIYLNEKKAEDYKLRKL